jgi:hypothetical protein
MTVSVVVMLSPMLTGFAPLQGNPVLSALTPTIPSGIVAYVPIAITNYQSTPTRAAFQQLVKVNSSTYADWEAPNLQNVEFFSLNGTVMTSWLESGNSSRSRSTIYWLNLRNHIPGGLNITVYMGFASTGSNLLNDRRTGEAPQLSPGYGEYDDGARVFLYYSDFAGSSLPTGWTSAPMQHLTNVSYSVDNGLTFPSQPACCGSIDYNRTYGSGTMIDVDATITGQTGGNGNYGGIVGYRLLYERGQTYWGVAGSLSPDNYTLQTCYTVPCTYLVSNKTYNSGTPVIGTIGFNGTDVVATNNYGAYVTNTSGLTAFPPPEDPTVQQGSSGISLFIQWLRVRESPPNGVMPTVTLGSLISVQASFSVEVVLLGGIAALVIIVIVLAFAIVRRRPKTTPS